MADSTAPGGQAAAKPYAAFVSYSHLDTEICNALHKRLESYAVPHSLVGRAGPRGKVGKRLGKFFRDRVDLAADHDLGTEIRDALERSAALIVLCSPQAAASPYVDREIRYFKSLGRGDRIFAAIASGEPHAAGKAGYTAADECFPRALMRRVDASGQLTNEPEPYEPIAADLRDDRDGLENGSLKLIAGLLDIGLDDLLQREKQAEARRRRQAYLISGAMGALAIVATVGGMAAYLNGETVKAQTAELTAQATALKEQTLRLVENEKTITGQLNQNRALTTRMQSVFREISAIAAEDETDLEKLRFLADGAPLGLSAEALNAMFDGEIGGMRAFAVEYARMRFCMGFNYCDTEFSAEDMQKDWASALSSEDLARIASVWGKRPQRLGDMASIVALEEPVKTIVLPRRASLGVFGKVQLPRFAEQVRRVWPHAENLPPDAFGALVHVIISQGPEAFQRIAASVADGTYPDGASAMRAEGRARAADAIAPHIGDLIIRRTEDQARRFEHGLESGDPGAPEAPS